VSATSLINAMTVDVEDYFQVSAFEPYIDRASWDRLPLRVERNTERILQLFDEHGVKATFFMLGWVAERCPQLLRRIVDGGHELASHGYSHIRVNSQSPEQFREDIARTRKLLEDISGVRIIGYRAASYSIGKNNLWALEELDHARYRYSSSIYPIAHDLYGIPGAPRFPFRPCAGDLVEVPISTIEVCGKRFPCGGGGYFRLFPYTLSRSAIHHVNLNEGCPCVFYFHPWEIDLAQPRPPGLNFKTRFRHYLNLGRMEERLRQLLRDFAWDRMDRVFLSAVEALPRVRISSRRTALAQ
jgi:polysaccharide deacetylase family protein (PEP-CTERM system associated)